MPGPGKDKGSPEAAASAEGAQDEAKAAASQEGAPSAVRTGAPGHTPPPSSSELSLPPDMSEHNEAFIKDHIRWKPSAAIAARLAEAVGSVRWFLRL